MSNLLIVGSKDPGVVELEFKPTVNKTKSELNPKLKNTKIISGPTVKRFNATPDVVQANESQVKQLKQTLSNKKLKHKVESKGSAIGFNSNQDTVESLENVQSQNAFPTLRMPKDSIPDTIREQESENDYANAQQSRGKLTNTSSKNSINRVRSSMSPNKSTMGKQRMKGRSLSITKTTKRKGGISGLNIKASTIKDSCKYIF